MSRCTQIRRVETNGNDFQRAVKDGDEDRISSILNFCRIHQSLCITPSMAAGLTDHVFEIEELVQMIEAREQEAIAAGAMRRGKYKKNDAK